MNLKITKDGPNTASQNQEADYTIKVTNDESTAATRPSASSSPPLP